MSKVPSSAKKSLTITVEQLFIEECILSGTAGFNNWKLFVLEFSISLGSYGAILYQEVDGKRMRKGRLQVSSQIATTSFEILLKPEEEARKEMEDSPEKEITFIIILSPSGDDDISLSFDAFKKYISAL